MYLTKCSEHLQIIQCVKTLFPILNLDKISRIVNTHSPLKCNLHVDICPTSLFIQEVFIL